MKEETKQKYLIVTEEEIDKGIPVEWTKLSVEVFDNLSSNYIYNREYVTESGEIKEKTVIYLKPVKKFSKNTIEFEEENCIIGINK